MADTHISICIPSYNRPESLRRLLESIDGPADAIEIVIAEDSSPGRAAIRETVTEFRAATPYVVTYVENEQNLGYDANLRNLVELARGAWIIFMGDDDQFIPGALTEYITFLTSAAPAKYILRSYVVVHAEGKVERFTYLPSDRRLPPGQESVVWLFKRSVSVSGFTIDRQLATEFSTDALDGTLLYQVYLMSRVCMEWPSMYCATPLTLVTQTYRDDKPMFGNAASERGRYQPGSVTFENSIRFTESYFEVTRYLDDNYSSDLTVSVRRQLSKYSYPFLSVQRRRGRTAFLKYCAQLAARTGLDETYYFRIYKWSLLVFGERVCDRTIQAIKGTLGYSPNL